MTDSDYEGMGPGTVSYYASLIQEGKPDVEGSRELLREFCRRARRLEHPSSPFPAPLLGVLVSAFERYLSGEAPDLEKSLGLKRIGTPADPEIPERNFWIAVEVFRLNAKGTPLRDNNAGPGAFSIVADRRALSESQVAEIYYQNKNEAKIHDRILRLLSDDEGATSA